MNQILKKAFQNEMQIAKNFYLQTDWENCFKHLERAHVLGQRNVISHTVNHWWMLKVGLKRRDQREILGQIARLLVAGIGSVLGKAPVGNTGGANVGIMQVVEIPPDLAHVFRKADG